MSVWSKIRGTTETLFQLSLGGPQLKNDSGGNIAARNSTDTGFVIGRGADPVGANDWVTKGSISTGTFRLEWFNGNPPTGNNPCAGAIFIVQPTNFQVDLPMQFVSGSQTNYAFRDGMPADWDGGTVTYRVCWFCKDSNSVNSAIFGLQGRAYASGDVIDQAYGTAVEVTMANTGQSTENMTAASAALTIGGSPAAGRTVRWQLYRKGTGGDTLAFTALVNYIEVTYNKA